MENMVGKEAVEMSTDERLREALETIARGELSVDCAAQEYAKNVLADLASSPAPQEQKGTRRQAIDFYNAKATNIVNVPRPDHPEDPSGIAGVHRAIEARFFAKDALVMSLSEACQFAEAYAAGQAANGAQPFGGTVGLDGDTQRDWQTDGPAWEKRALEAEAKLAAFAGGGGGTG